MRKRPSELLNLQEDDYVAYCLDEAVIYFGLRLQSMLEEAGHKPSKEERRAAAAREALMAKIFEDEKQGSGFADPAMMFK